MKKISLYLSIWLYFGTAWDTFEGPVCTNVSDNSTIGILQYSRSLDTGCAANTALLLGLSKDRHGDVDSLTAEVRRRRFWACYVHGSFQTRTLFPMNPTDEMSNLFLPCRESDYDIGKPQDLVTLKTGRCNGSIRAEIVRVMALWYDTRYWSPEHRLIQYLGHPLYL